MYQLGAEAPEKATQTGEDLLGGAGVIYIAIKHVGHIA